MRDSLRSLSVTLGVAAILTLAACEFGPKRLAGGGSDIGNGSAIAGMVLTTDGIPARGALARLRPSGYLSPLPAGSPKAGAAADSLGETHSDAKGRFAFAHILPGRYRIEVVDSARAQGVLIDCKVDSGGKDVELAEAHFAATGSLSLHAPAGAAAGTSGYIRLAGLERLARLSAGDSLRLEGLPAGGYVVDVASKDTAFAALSGTTVSLHPGENTAFDSTALPCANRVCDSLALTAFFTDNGITEPIARFIKGSSRIDEVVLNALPYQYHFKTMAALKRLTALKVFKVEGPFLADSNMAPLFDALAGMDSLWLLSISWSKDSGFTALPASIGKLHALRELYLLGDSLHTVPGEIGNLSKLEFLSLQFNQLAELPDWGGLTVLRELQVPHNRLHVLPETIFTLNAIAKIDIADNHLCSFTDAQKTWLEARNAYAGPEGQTCP